MSHCHAPVDHQHVTGLPDRYWHISQASELFSMQAHIIVALIHECRGFVRETPAQRRHLREAPSSGGEGRPLGAGVDVIGINRTISASAEFGDFYRHVSQAHSALYVALTPSVHLQCDECAANSDELYLQAARQLSAQACHAKWGVATRYPCAGRLRQEDTMSPSLSEASPMRPGPWMCRRMAQG